MYQKANCKAPRCVLYNEKSPQVELVHLISLPTMKIRRVIAHNVHIMSCNNFSMQHCLLLVVVIAKKEPMILITEPLKDVDRREA